MLNPSTKGFTKKDTNQVFISSGLTVAVRRLKASGSKNNINVATSVKCTQPHSYVFSFPQMITHL